MIKRRIIAAVTVKNGIVVQSFDFSRYLPVGKPEIVVEALNHWNADEILLVDIDAARNRRCIDPDLVHRISKRCFVPLTVGGGITTSAEISSLLRSGADKVLINSHALSEPSIITQAAQYYGNQCVIAGIDCKLSPHGEYYVYDHIRKAVTEKKVIDWALELQELGAGEILLNSVDRDGTKKGYDLKILRDLGKKLSVPLIACGGVGHPNHFKEAWPYSEISALAAGNFFQFSEHSVTTTKAFLEMNQISMLRLDEELKYTDFEFDELGRPVAPSEAPF